MPRKARVSDGEIMMVGKPGEPFVIDKMRKTINGISYLPSDRKRESHLAAGGHRLAISGRIGKDSVGMSGREGGKRAKNNGPIVEIVKVNNAKK